MKLAVENEIEFAEACQAIAAGWASRRDTGDATTWLELHAYQLISPIVSSGSQELWAKRATRLSQRGPKARPNPFLEGLRVIFVDKPELLPSQKRERIAVRLEYAHRHFVPACFLRGFLRSVGRPDRLNVEDGFEDWVAYHLRWAGDGVDLPEGYPRHIVQRATEIPRSAIHTLSILDTIVIVRDQSGNRLEIPPGEDGWD